MLSVIIATHNSEAALVRTLAPLVSGATAGLVSEVLVTDAGSRDQTASVCDVTGCNLMVEAGPLGRRLNAAAAAARAPWLLFLRPGIVLEAAWVGEAGHFIAGHQTDDAAAVFRRGTSAQAPLLQALSLVAAALGGGPRAEQGLLIAKRYYDRLGGHSERAADPESDLNRRIGRRRLTTLAAAAFAGSR